jgi:hypothetical protein
MSYFFLPTDVWIPASSETTLNPIASVWLKSTLGSICSVAPVLPLLRGWALYVGQHEVIRSTGSPQTSKEYKGAINALFKFKPSISFFFRGCTPLLASIPLTSSFALAASVSGLMATSLFEEQERIKSAATATAAVLGGELLIQPLRYLYFQLASDRTGALKVRTAWRQASWTALYRGVGAAMVASSILQLGPHLERYFGIQQNSKLGLSVEIGGGLLAYMCYMLSFRRACTSKGVSPISSGQLFREGPFVIGAGVLSMVACRVMVSTLQVAFSANSHLIPF